MKAWLRTNLLPMSGPLLLLFIAIVLPLALFGHIADEVRDGDTLGFDNAVLNQIHSLTSPWGAVLTPFFVFVARWGGFYGLVPLAVLVTAYLGIKQQRGKALYFFLSVTGACLLNVTAKGFFGRARPDLWLSPAPEKDFSFPSGHAMLSTAFFVALIVLAWPTKWRLPALLGGVLAVGLIVLSRLYLGVHYPTDVVGGICASLTWTGGLTWTMHHRRHFPFLRWLSATSRTRIASP